MTLGILEKSSVMVHIALRYTEIAAGLDEEKKDIMVARCMIDSDGFEDLKQARVGEAREEEGYRV